MEPSVRSFRPAASLTEQIADHIADEIIRGRMIPGERIRELRVARALGVSRGSIREALLLLQRRHLIDMVPRRGAVVADLSRRQLDDLFELLETLLGLVGRRMTELWDEEDRERFEPALAVLEDAAARGDTQAWADAADELLISALDLVRNQYLDAVIEALLPVARRALYRIAELDPTVLDAGTRHWRALLDAFAAGDRQEMESLLACRFAGYRAALDRAVCH
ncbi:MAG: GntR family transcriptional regulator [Gammaproteobacteria bacterium]|nr:GntR family transcriptional regulator [Gammaproteobacteria bacterium]